MTGGPVTRILIVEDNARHAELIIDELGDNELANDVVWAPTGEKGFEALEESPCDLILLDYRLPDTDGIGFLKEIRNRGHMVPVIFVTTADSVELAVEAMRLGAEDFLQKQEGYLEILPLMIRSTIQRIQLREQKTHLEAQLQQSEKLASVGVLAAGLAHNINNRLTSLKTYFELISAEDEAPPFDKNFVQICHQDLDRIVLLVQELTRYAFSESDVDQLSEPMSELLIRAIGHVEDHANRKDIRIRQDFNPVPQIPLEGEGIKQLLINLLKNAIEASPPNSEIVVTLQVQHEEGGDKIALIVEDSGTGLPQEMRDKIFDPFYTTKDHGLGVGLFLCHKIATQHGGRIQVTEAESGGARFSVLIPIPKDQSSTDEGAV